MQSNTMVAFSDNSSVLTVVPYNFLITPILILKLQTTYSKNLFNS